MAKSNEAPFEKSKVVKMNGLRIYINQINTVALSEERAFYSRRADGPYYRWQYESEVGQWHSSRVHPSDITIKALCIASWKAVPTALQARLVEHYLD